MHSSVNLRVSATALLPSRAGDRIDIPLAQVQGSSAELPNGWASHPALSFPGAAWLGLGRGFLQHDPVLLGFASAFVVLGGHLGLDAASMRRRHLLLVERRFGAQALHAQVQCFVPVFTCWREFGCGLEQVGFFE